MSVELLLSLVVAVGVIVAGYWALALLVVKQFERRLDDRFAAQEQARIEGRKQFDARWTKIETDQRRHERDLLELKADLPLHYVRREDYVRNQTVIEAKLDGLALRIQNALLKGSRDV
jgi:hypothetical protein